jgi:hypothetical protein
MTEALAPRSCFIGGISPTVIHLYRDFTITLDWSLIGWGLLIWFGLSVVSALLWYLYLEIHDHRTSYQKWLDRKADEADETEYFQKWNEKHNKKK